MLVTIITHCCPRCGSTEVVRNGHDYKGVQKYHCKACNAYGTLDAQSGYGEAKRLQVRRGCSVVSPLPC